jgi:hypothetical protein
MAAFEVIALDTATPQLRAPGATDTYTHPRQSLFLAGTAAAPGIAGNSDDNTGMLWPAADTVAWATGGTERMRLDSSGNLGLGVTPSAWFSPSSRAIDFTFPYVGMDVSGAGVFGFNAYNSTGSTWIYKSDDEANRFSANIDGSFTWHIAPSGTAGNPISFTQAMKLDASGNLGVGNTSPTYRLDVSIASGPYSARFNNISTSTSEYNVVVIGQGASGSAVGYFGTGGSAVGNAAFANSFVVGTQTSNPLVFNTNDAEKARIPAAGGMVVGTAALTTTATDGFLYVPTCAGTPTGTPTTQTGTAPIVINTTNNKLYFYSGGAWRDAGP